MAIFGTQAKKRKETRGDKASYAIADGLRALGLGQYDASRYGRKLGTPLGAIGDFLAMPRDAVDAHFVKQDEALRAGKPQTFLSRLPETLNVITSGTDLGPAVSMAAVAAKPVVGMFGRNVKNIEKNSQFYAPGIIAYHGSPYNFLRFDMSKIGTGEGAQAYGHGLYFAESEDVAKQYRQKLAGKLDNILDMRNVDSALVNAAKGMREYGHDEAQILDVLRKSYPKNSEDVLRNAYLMSNPGSMYQVRIDANPDDFIDWDALLSDQNPKIKNILGDSKILSAGEPLLRALHHPMHAGDILKTDRATPKELSEGLKNLGIPGIKYFDDGSRAIGEGTRNFVVFDDKLITILKKYGWVPGTAVPAALMSRAQEEAQAQDEVY